mmetsp:Transcript_4071/g.13419  ORF Transcript_4071/g.13419 Transcript_4071/m.13419 type:complete len:283 (+) Transcript_4071:2071-2919(+)
MNLSRYFASTNPASPCDHVATSAIKNPNRMPLRVFFGSLKSKFCTDCISEPGAGRFLLFLISLEAESFDSFSISASIGVSPAIVRFTAAVTSFAQVWHSNRLVMISFGRVLVFAVRSALRQRGSVLASFVMRRDRRNKTPETPSIVCWLTVSVCAKALSINGAPFATAMPQLSISSPARPARTAFLATALERIFLSETILSSGISCKYRLPPMHQDMRHSPTCASVFQYSCDKMLGGFPSFSTIDSSANRTHVAAPAQKIAPGWPSTSRIFGLSERKPCKMQ